MQSAWNYKSYNSLQGTSQWADFAVPPPPPAPPVLICYMIYLIYAYSGFLQLLKKSYI